MHDGKDEGSKGQGSEMVPKEHFVGSKDGEVGFLFRAVRVVPDAASTGDDEGAHGLDESVAPKGSEQEDVKLH